MQQIGPEEGLREGQNVGKKCANVYIMLHVRAIWSINPLDIEEHDTNTEVVRKLTKSIRTQVLSNLEDMQECWAQF